MIPTVAVIGCGYWGRNLVRNFHQLGALQLVCDTTEEGRTAAAATAPGCEVVSDLEAALVSPVPAVVIATPAETHFSLTRRALEAGKDVFVEKAPNSSISHVHAAGSSWSAMSLSTTPAY